MVYLHISNIHVVSNLKFSEFLNNQMYEVLQRIKGYNYYTNSIAKSVVKICI